MGEKAVKRIGSIVAAIIFIPIILIGVVIATVDANKYRADIARVLTEQTGRKVQLNGNMSLSFSSGGVVLVIDDVVIGNAAWARDKEMAQIGHLELAVAIAPLISHQLKVSRFVVSNADLKLETNAEGKGNWELKPKSGAGQLTTTEGQEGQPAQKIDFALDEALIRDTRVSYLDGKKGGVPTELTISNLKVGMDDKTVIEGSGKVGGQEFKIDLAGGAFADLTNGKEWPVQLKAAFGDYSVAGAGKTTQTGKMASFDDLTIGMPQGELKGKVSYNGTGNRPKIKGDLSAEKLTLATKTEAAIADVVDKATGKSENQRMFSDEKLDLSGLRSVDATVGLKIAQLEAPAATLENIETTVNLANGNWAMTPINFALAGNPLEARVNVNAAATPQVDVTLKGKNVDSDSILRLWGLDKVVVGKADLDVNLSGQGDSPHAIASSMNGSMGLEVGKGEIPASGMRQMASGLMTILLPGSDGATSAELTCLSDKFDVQNGVATSKGLLIDTNLVTVAGAGGFNLREETINMMLRPLPKQKSLLDTAVPLRISGPLNRPGFNLDAAGVAQTAASKLLGVQLPTNGLRVPVVDASAGPGNPCTLALANPTYATTEQKPGVLSPKVEETKQAIGDKAKGLADQLSKGLGSKLFGE